MTTTDDALLKRARAGDRAAFADLYRLHHRPVLRAAQRHAGPGPAEDLVAEAFTRTFAQILDGAGPTTAVRAYLNTAVRNLYASLIRKDHRVVVTEEQDVLEGTTGPVDPWTGLADRDLVRAAFDALPVRDRTVLWWITVERRPAEELAAAWHRTPQAIHQHAFRAREALRVAYLNAHVPEPSDDACRRVIPLLSRRARGGLDTAASRAHKALDHVHGCAVCTAAGEEINDVARTSIRGVR